VPTVNPAPTDASSARLPFFNFPCVRAGVHGQWDGGSGGVAVLVNIDDDFVGGHAQAVSGGHDDAAIGLMRDEDVNVFSGKPIAGEESSPMPPPFS